MRWPFLFFFSFLHANPSDPQVVAGKADFQQTAPEVLEITTSDKAIINWKEFSIEEQELTKFHQPRHQSAVLNRVLSGDPSHLKGRLEANGHVYLINPNGVLIGKNAVINTHNFIVQTYDLDNEVFLDHDFESGPLFIAPPEGGERCDCNPFALAIQHEGLIEANRVEERGGHVYLVADRGVVEVTGTTKASEVKVMGGCVHLRDEALIDVSGGGTVQCKGRQIVMDHNVNIEADGALSGDGGNLSFFADEIIGFYGRISAEGGPEGGNGGSVHIFSPGFVDFRGRVKLSAPEGEEGILRLEE